MISRPAKETSALVWTFLSLAIGVGVGSVVSVTTKSWVHRFLPWQLAWWLFISLALGILVYIFGNGERIRSTPFARLIIASGHVGAVASLAGLGISIYIMVAGDAETAPFAAYWLFPIATWRMAVAEDIRSAERGRLERQVAAKRAVFHADLRNIEAAIAHVIDNRRENWEKAEEPQKLKWQGVFEGQFIQALYMAAEGGIRPAKLGDVWVRWNLYLSPESAQLQALLSRLDEVEHRYPARRHGSEIGDVGWWDSFYFFRAVDKAKGRYLLSYGSVFEGSCSSEHFRDLDSMTESAIIVWRKRGDVKTERSDSTRNSTVHPSMKLSLTVRGLDLCRRAQELDSVVQALREREAGYRVDKQINISNSQISGFVGDHNVVVGGSFEQRISTMDHISLESLARELSNLTEVLDANLRENGMSLGMQEQVIAIAEAAKAAGNGDRGGVVKHLARAGQWALDTATQIGSALAVEAIRAVLKV